MTLIAGSKGCLTQCPSRFQIFNQKTVHKPNRVVCCAMWNTTRSNSQTSRHCHSLFLRPAKNFVISSQGSSRDALHVRVQSLPDALLFDCDGVLVDTEAEGHRVAFNEAFRRKGAFPCNARHWMKLSLLHFCLFLCNIMTHPKTRYIS